jgi:hypothetical protein
MTKTGFLDTPIIKLEDHLLFDPPTGNPVLLAYFLE